MPELPFNLGPYVVERELGRGGMGVVYAGRDTRLERTVAIKALSDDLAGEPEFMTRFRREAQLLAQLNSAQIATVYGVEESEGNSYLVMEFIDGESLSERLRRSPMSVEEALRTASSIAAGMATAHDEGIVHRDLKPSNVMLSRSGVVKVLDFGVAQRQGPRREDDPLEPTTATGAVVGSPGYMSPEQALGEEFDKRTDVFAFGCVLYECLTGRRAFTGRNFAEFIAAVALEDPDWSRLPPRTPPRVRDLLERCLRKQAVDRMRDLGDAHLELETSLARREWAKAPPGTRRAPPWWVVAAVAVVVGVALSPLVFPTAGTGAEAGSAVTCLEVLPPPDHRLRLFTPSIRLSPNAQYLTFHVERDLGGVTTLIRPLDAFQSHPLHDEAYLQELAFSPDGRWLTFCRGGRVKKMRIGSSPTVETICTNSVLYGMSWLANGWIIFSGALGSGLHKVNHEGGTPTECTSVVKDRGELLHAGPVPAWDDDGILFVVGKGPDWEQSEVALGNIDGRPHRILTKGKLPFAIEPDLLVVCRGHQLYGARVDLQNGSLRNEPVLIPGITVRYGNLALPQMWVTVNGDLAYVEGSGGGRSRRPFVIDRQGKTTACVKPSLLPTWPAFSPDGKRVAFAALVGSSRELFSWEWQRDLVDAVTSRTLVYESDPSWSADGKHLRYFMHVDGQYGVHSKRASGIGESELITTVSRMLHPSSWLPDGSGFAAVATARGDGTSSDIWIIRRTAEGWQEDPFLDGPSSESTPAISPDGKFLAYASDDTGRQEVYVVPFPSKDNRWRVSRHGGVAPRWSDSGELFFKRAAEIWTASYTTEPEFAVGTVTKVLDCRELLGSTLYGRFDVSPDGQHFAVILADANARGDDSEPVIRVVLNWVETWRDLLPAK